MVRTDIHTRLADPETWRIGKLPFLLLFTTLGGVVAADVLLGRGGGKLINAASGLLLLVSCLIQRTLDIQRVQYSSIDAVTTSDW